ncbi:MAG: polysaccharide biosynthesis protein [Clostridia bacterium]|nr:polysaccharide biosynthesis protein [Clostridia bacterium]
MNTTKTPFTRNLALYLIDSAIVLLSYLLTWFSISFADGVIPQLSAAVPGLCIILGVFTACFSLLRVNRTIWRYAGGIDYILVFSVTCFSGAISCLILVLIGLDPVPFIFNVYAALISSAAMTLSRVVYRELVNSSFRTGVNSGGTRLLIVGAGVAGSRILEEIRSNPSCGLFPVGFADDNMQKLRRSIHGVRVLGKTEDIPAIAQAQKIELIYIAIPSATTEQRSRIVDLCAETKIPVKILPYYAEICDSTDFIGKVRDITPEELLGREPIRVADEEILNFVRGKTVVITGGGGSIGSELSRQIASHQPKRLIIIDVYENNAYALQQELLAKYPDTLDLVVYIATVCDYKKINALFAAEKPDIVLHAAAHKHVPLMETVPDEAVKNNVFGTYNTAMAARENKVGKFILISTDKAVNPTNIMGATKRMCEMIIQYADTISPDTSYAAVRFGNVLGSNGSVIPLFKSQIEQRHDVTVTHPDMIRYFMTIPEASQLVLTASAMAKGGEIFVLDMGKPVKIADLAKKMIQLSGLTIGQDINIRYIGLRPGEKLYEELLMSEEGLRKTLNEKIFIGSPISMDYAEFKKQLSELKLLVNEDGVTPEAVEAKMKEIVPTFIRFGDMEESKKSGDFLLSDAPAANVVL